MALLFSSSGATCPRVPQQKLPPPPPMFSSAPNLQQLVQAINQNSAKVRQLQTQEADVTIQGIPASLRANLALEMPRHIRFRADTSLTGAEMDLGSNDELFWLWVKRSEPPAIFYGRHAQLHRLQATNIVPVEPSWLVEALGFVQIDPRQQIDGPFQAGQDHLEIRQRVVSAKGTMTKSTIIHSTYGWVVRQSVYDSRNMLLASSRLSEHRYYPEQGVSLPHKVEIQLPPAQIAFTMDVESYTVNQPTGNANLFSPPQMEGYRFVDLTAPPRNHQPPPQPQRNVQPRVGTVPQPRHPTLQRTPPVPYPRRSGY